MPNFVDITGHRYGRYTAIERSGTGPRGMAVWRVRCDCGTEKNVIGNALRTGQIRSCGCLAAEVRFKHGFSSHPAYGSWCAMNRRCYDENADSWAYYGGRGITVCERWRDSFDSFWDDMGPTWAPGLSIDRIDGAGNYCPENCRWATSIEQNNNLSSNVVIETPSGPMNLSEAARKYGIGPRTLAYRKQQTTDIAAIFRPPSKGSPLRGARRAPNISINEA